ncbi:MAG: hypothetical protein QF769_03505 [Candidatus Marinimicrobia bacterium]|nr:hypothetical protein [Candidatus Neomarinimicrobiota bacterium]
MSSSIRSAFILLIVSGLTGQTVSDYPFTGVLGSASVGTMTSATGGIHSLYHNPATMVDVTDHIINVGSAEIYGIPYTHVGWINKLSGFGVIGLSTEFSKVNYQKIDLSKEQRMGISHGFHLQKDKNSELALGLTLNHFSWTLGPSAGTAGDGSDGIQGGMSTAWGLDFGVIGVLRNKHRVGAMVKNLISTPIGTGGSEQSLPKRLSAGVSYTPFSGLQTSFLFERIIGRDLQIKGSVQFKVNSAIQVITGIQSNPNRLGAGFIVSFSRINIGYALLTHPVLPLVHQTEISYKFQN